MKRDQRRSAAAAVLVLVLGLSLALGAAAQNRRPVKSAPPLIADRRLIVATAAGSGELPLYLSADWDRPEPAITRAILAIHGVLRDADTSRTIAEAVRAASGVDPQSVLLVEPQFLDDRDVADEPLPPQTLHWSHTGWEDGEDAHGPAPISSFAALDAILTRLADRAAFPALKTIVVAGHSGGGQLAQRYAVAARDEALAKAGILVRYVVASPSSYVYFSPDRPAGAGFAPFDAAACPAYDRWKYGLSGAPPYLAGRAAGALEEAYAGRDVIYLLALLWHIFEGPGVFWIPGTRFA